MYHKKWEGLTAEEQLAGKEQLTVEEQNLYLTLLWQDGHSEKAIADFFGTTKGRIVRRRHSLKLGSTGRPEAKGKVDPERFQDLLDLHGMREMEKTEGANVSAIAPVTKPETECQWPLTYHAGRESELCGKPAKPGHRLCEEHLALATRKS